MAKTTKAKVGVAGKINVSERAMLIRPHFSAWNAYRADEQVTEDVHSRYSSEHTAGRYKKKLLVGKEFDEVNTAINRIRHLHNRKTLPWDKEGWGILAAQGYLDYVEEMNAQRKDFDKAVRTLVRELPNLKKKDKKRLGRMYNEEDYPSPQALTLAYSMRIQVLPLPAATDFRVKQLQSTVMDDLRSSIQHDVQDRLTEAANDLWERLFKLVNRLHDRLSNSDAIIRDSIVTSVAEACDLIPKMDIFGDPKLAEITKKAKAELTKYQGDALREDDKLRKEVAAKAEKIVKAMGAYMGSTK
ncbi:hypothetical protein C4564_02075 [Candidatus Microgenomates bacterium]|nr:MAG: hypothetical protein C4564_02075 [Candidatus Microgenomates bacterium]